VVRLKECFFGQKGWELQQELLLVA